MMTGLFPARSNSNTIAVMSNRGVDRLANAQQFVRMVRLHHLQETAQALVVEIGRGGWAWDPRSVRQLIIVRE